MDVSLKSMLALEIAEQLSNVVLKAIKVAACSVPSGKGYYLSESTSNFISSLEVVPNPSDEALVQIIVPAYVKYIESGRPAHARKVPVRVLIDWCNEKHIPSDNEVVYAIREAIYQDGIAPRPIMSAIDQAAHQAIDQFKPNITKALIAHLKRSIRRMFSGN